MAQGDRLRLRFRLRLFQKITGSYLSCENSFSEIFMKVYFAGYRSNFNLKKRFSNGIKRTAGHSIVIIKNKQAGF